MRTSPASSVGSERTRHRPERDDPCGLRCLCGSLLARLVDDHVELKCKRCKRMMVVPLSGLPREMSTEIQARGRHDAE